MLLSKVAHSRINWHLITKWLFVRFLVFPRICCVHSLKTDEYSIALMETSNLLIEIITARCIYNHTTSMFLKGKHVGTCNISALLKHRCDPINYVITRQRTGLILVIALWGQQSNCLRCLLICLWYLGSSSWISDERTEYIR